MTTILHHVGETLCETLGARKIKVDWGDGPDVGTEVRDTGPSVGPGTTGPKKTTEQGQVEGTLRHTLYKFHFSLIRWGKEIGEVSRFWKDGTECSEMY